MDTLQSSDAKESLDQHSPLSVAELLINARKAQGYSIEDIAHHLKVSQSYIEAIESNDTAGLPVRAYALGFVRSYAKFLKQDSDHLVKRFKEEILKDPIANTSLSFPNTLTLDSSPQKKILWLSSGIVVCLLILSLGFWQWGRLSKVEDIPEKELMPESSKEEHPSTPLQEESRLFPSRKVSSKPEDLNPDRSSEQHSETMNLKDASSSDSSSDSDPLSNTNVLSDSDSLSDLQSVRTPTQDFHTSPPEKISSMPLRLTFLEACWLRIQDMSGNIVIEKTFHKGEVYTISDQNRYTLHTGNAGAIEVLSALWPEARVLGKKGQVIQNLSLDSQTLSAYLNQQ